MAQVPEAEAVVEVFGQSIEEGDELTIKPEDRTNTLVATGKVVESGAGPLAEFRDTAAVCSREVATVYMSGADIEEVISNDGALDDEDGNNKFPRFHTRDGDSLGERLPVTVGSCYLRSVTIPDISANPEHLTAIEYEPLADEKYTVYHIPKATQAYVDHEGPSGDCEKVAELSGREVRELGRDESVLALVEELRQVVEDEDDTEGD